MNVSRGPVRLTFTPLTGTLLSVRWNLKTRHCMMISLRRRLIEVLEDKIVRPAEAKFNELLARRSNQLRVENV